MMLHINRVVYQQMVAHVQSLYPYEGCGILAGPPAYAMHHYAIDNRHQSEVVYEMDPLQQVQAMMEIEAKSWTMVAIYHSHPQGPATPSPTDIAQAYYPETVQIIISLQNRQMPNVRAFTIINDVVNEVLWRIL